MRKNFIKVFILQWHHNLECFYQRTTKSLYVFFHCEHYIAKWLKRLYFSKKIEIDYLIYHDWRVHIHEQSACEFESIHWIAMQCFFHIIRIHNRIIRSRAFVAKACHTVFWLDASRNRCKFEKNVWFQTFIFFSLFDFDSFSSRESDFRVRDRNRERCYRRIDDESKHVENDLRLAYEV